MFDNEDDSKQLSRRERERKRHREEILEAASEVFGQYGFEKTSMQMIAEKAELSVGKIYTHFKGKEAIYRELIEYIVTLVHQRCEDAVKPGMSPLETIRVKMRTAMCTFRDHTPFIRLYHEDFDIRKGRFGDVECKKPMMDISSLLKEAIESGEFSGEIDPEFHALMMEGAGHILMESISRSGTDSFDKITELLDKVFLKPFENKKQQ
ncbi:MAG: TetR/AcrR family transcriptional regulator [Candidatus Krumholzibacteriota bacterium]|nr:TetR/AcrR family transcriptional regulator [Candidatus Krumholzibacteriota bacterium]